MDSLEAGVNIAIIDIECTCDDVEPIPRGEVEIIEVGGVIVTISPERCDLIDQFQIFVKPEVHQKLTPFCIELTGIGQDTVDHGCSLGEAFDQLESTLAKHQVSTWGSWGKFDSTQFELEATEKSLNNPFSEMTHLNIKQLYARKMKHRVGLARAIMLEGMEFEGRHHSGIDDAKNIARIIAANGLVREAALSRTPED